MPRLPLPYLPTSESKAHWAGGRLRRPSRSGAEHGAGEWAMGSYQYGTLMLDGSPLDLGAESRTLHSSGLQMGNISLRRSAT